MVDLIEDAGLRRSSVATTRLRIAVVETVGEGAPVVAVHGNCSSSTFFARFLAGLPDGFHGIAPDLRGFGDTEPLPIDATRGMRDFSEDLLALLDARDVESAAFVAHSAGAGAVLQLAIDHPDRVRSLVLVAPMSPHGFGGTGDAAGNPCFADYAGSGGGTANPEFVAGLAAGDRTTSSPTSPRNVLNNFYVKAPCALPDEEALLDSVLTTRVGDGHYPGAVVESPNWPGVAPGTTGMNNAISPAYFDVSAFAEIRPRPPVLWIRGADDAIVSDTSLFDLGHLGALGAVPGWPGEDVVPAQPMVAQMRAMLERYAANGGHYTEEVLADTGHSPQLERPEQFAALVLPFLHEHAS